MDLREHIEIPAGTPRTRLEDFLFDQFPDLSRMYLRDVVREGKCEVNGRVENVGFRVRGGDYIEVALDRSRETAMKAENIALDIIFEDEHLVVVNKPAGMLVHPTHREKTGTMLNALAFYFNAERGMPNAEFTRYESKEVDTASGSPHSNSAFRIPHSAFIRPGLVHRLDKETSGLIVVAKSVAIHRKLARQFQKKQVTKKYLALVGGVFDADEGTIEGPIGRYAAEKRWGVKHDGKHSITRYSVLARHADSTLMELEPVTGRTNQLRIHCASIGHPIIGDVSRGGRAFGRLCLHAWKLAFKHPCDGEGLEFTSNQDFLTREDQ